MHGYASINCPILAIRKQQIKKQERIKQSIYKTREQARLDIVDYIEWFYNAKRRHSYCDNMSPAQFEETYYLNRQDAQENLGSSPNNYATRVYPDR